jgi:emfourin
VHVKVTQRGGFIGSEVTLVQLDTARLNEDVRHEVEKQIANITRQRAGKQPIGADLLEYTLTVDDQGRHDAVTWVDDGGGSAAPIRDLVARLQQLQ